MTIAILDPCAEDRSRIREALAGSLAGPFVEFDPTQPIPDEAFAEIRLALLETDLPGGTAFDLLERLRVSNPDLPVVVVTRRVEPDRIVAAMKAGACDHVGKDRLDRLPEVARAALADRGGMPIHARLRAADAIAHDLRNVFQTIRLAADLLRRIADEARRGPLLDTMIAGIARGRELLGRMILVARVEEPSGPTTGEVALPVVRREVILIIDDEPDICDLVRLVVQERGYRTLTARDGAEALTLFQNHQHEVAAVIVDLKMPVLDGPAVIRSLREKVPTLAILPISGLPAAPAMLAGLSLRYFLPKPFTAGRLLDTLERLLSEGPRSWPAS
jgi:DNA-binding response OmpR family regulator